MRAGSASAARQLVGQLERRAAGPCRRCAGASASATSRTTSRRSMARRWTSTRPASTRATSSRSLTRSTSRLVDTATMSTNSRWRSRQRLVGGQQLDEALDRGQRAAQLVRGGRDELALQPLQPRALGRVAHGPGDAGVAGELRGGEDERAAVVLERDLAAERVRRRRQHRRVGKQVAGALVGVLRPAPSAPTISRPSVSERIVVSSRARSPSIRRVAVSRSRAIALNEPAERAQLAGARPRRTRAPRSPPASRSVAPTSSSSGRRSEPTSARHERERCQQREHAAGDDHGDGDARVVAGRAPRSGEPLRLARRQRGDRRARGRAAGCRARDELRAARVAVREPARLRELGRERLLRARALRRSPRGLGHDARREQPARRGLQPVGVRQPVLVALARRVEPGHAQPGDDREHEREPEQRDAHRTRDRQPSHGAEPTAPGTRYGPVRGPVLDPPGAARLRGGDPRARGGRRGDRAVRPGRRRQHRSLGEVLSGPAVPPAEAAAPRSGRSPRQAPARAHEGSVPERARTHKGDSPLESAVRRPSAAAPPVRQRRPPPAAAAARPCSGRLRPRAPAPPASPPPRAPARTRSTTPARRSPRRCARCRSPARSRRTPCRPW